jgi:oxygen-independent coproporphyrinogen-3 oxidase
LEIISLYFGGGTPFLHPEAIRAILDRASRLKLHPQVEITVEANPEQLTFEKLQAFKNMGVNRLSLGIQSLDDELLKLLGRTHTSQKGIQAVEMAYREGFDNLTIDLMYELPYQTLSTWKQTLSTLKTLPITHLSLYNLTFEKQTIFAKKESKLRPHLPSPEESVTMLEMLCMTCKEMHLSRYEISAFAKPNYMSVHNRGYWIGRPFLGLGPSAFSDWNGKRFQNVSHLKRYEEKLNQGEIPIDFEEELPYPANLHERLAIHLRLTEGIKKKTFPIPKTAYPILEELKEEGLLQESDESIFLTERGLLFYDLVAEKIIY